jgi:RNA polymerase sigma-70 factor (ECF subfamily)
MAGEHYHLPISMSLLFCLLPLILISISLLWLLPTAVAYPDDEDDATVRLAQNGDRAAFNRLVGKYQGQMYNIAYRIMGDSDGAADATQDAFIAAYKKLNQYTGGNFRAWMARIVKNQCFDTLRYKQRRPASSLDDLILEPNDRGIAAFDGDELPNPESLLERAEVVEWLELAIQQLPVDQRTTLVMADIHEYSYEEIAASMEVELGTVKSRLFRARRRLRELLQDKTELLPPQYRS